MYGEAEASLAVAFEGCRDDVTLATKIWAQTLEEGREQYQRQLDWFGKVDVEQVHNLVLWREHLEWIEEERGAGRIGMVGVTHWNRDALPDLADALRTGRFEQVQLPYNPEERDCEEELLPIAAEQGLAVIVMRPFADGGLLASPPPQEALEPLRPFGIETWPQALLKWVLSDERVDVAIPATSRPSARARTPQPGSAVAGAGRARLRRPLASVGASASCVSASSGRSSRRAPRRPDARGRASWCAAATTSWSRAERARQRVRGRRLRGGRRPDRLRRRHLGGGRAPAQGERADRGGVPAAARRSRPLHVPPPRRGRAAHARARRLRVAAVAYETVETDDRQPAAARADERGRGPPGHADGFLGAREAARRARHAARRRVPGVPPAKVLVIGGGIVGYNAALIAVGMQADVWVLDKSVERMRDLEMMLDGRITLAMSNELQIQESRCRTRTSSSAPLIPGARAPKLITREMLPTMKQGSVLVDVAIDQGGCAETSRPTTHSDPTYVVDDVVHYCVANMPGAVPISSTKALTNVTLPVRRGDREARARSCGGAAIRRSPRRQRARRQGDLRGRRRGARHGLLTARRRAAARAGLVRLAAASFVPGESFTTSQVTLAAIAMMAGM